MSYQEVAEAVEPCQEEASFLYREMTRQREVRRKKSSTQDDFEDTPARGYHEKLTSLNY